MCPNPKRPRILTLDLLRGYFLFVVIIDHVGFFPSVFEFFTGRGELWASAAEGFFIISGLLVGYIYGPRMAQNVKQATKKLWGRALLLYILTVLLTFLFVWWGSHSDIAHVKEGLWPHPPLGEFIFKAITLQYYYGWFDFLPYYAIFMAVAPLALYACVKRLGWLVIAASVVCWMLRGNSFEMAWQLLFTGSLVAGWYLPQLEARWRTLQLAKKQWLTLSIYSLAISLVLCSALSIHVAPFMLHQYTDFAALPIFLQKMLVSLDQFRQSITPFIDKWTLEPLRLATAAIWFVALYIFARRHEAVIDRLSYGLLRKLGERSLAVYVTHAFVIFALMLMALDNKGFVANTLLGTIVVFIVYGIATRASTIIRWAKKSATTRLQVNREEI